MIIPPNVSLIFASLIIRFRDLNYEKRIEKRENLHFSRLSLDYKLSENKQGAYFFAHVGQSHIQGTAPASPADGVGDGVADLAPLLPMLALYTSAQHSSKWQRAVAPEPLQFNLVI